MESWTQPLVSFLYQRMGMPVFRISGEICTWTHSPRRPTMGKTVPLVASTITSFPGTGTGVDVGVTHRHADLGQRLRIGGRQHSFALSAARGLALRTCRAATDQTSQ